MIQSKFFFILFGDWNNVFFIDHSAGTDTVTSVMCPVCTVPTLWSHTICFMSATSFVWIHFPPELMNIPPVNAHVFLCIITSPSGKSGGGKNTELFLAPPCYVCFLTSFKSYFVFHYPAIFFSMSLLRIDDKKMAILCFIQIFTVLSFLLVLQLQFLSLSDMSEYLVWVPCASHPSLDVYID